MSIFLVNALEDGWSSKESRTMNGSKSCTFVGVTVDGKDKSKPEVCGVVTPNPVDV